MSLKNEFSALKLMGKRLGVCDNELSSSSVNLIEGVENQLARLHQHGGIKQQERMIKDKRRSLERALWHSYQGANIVKVGAESEEPIRALINPNKLKLDYDDKIISIGHEHGFNTGTVFEWVGTNTYWIVYLQDLTELAYFRGDIRKCSYKIAWEDEQGNSNFTYAAVRGPVETKINYIQKHGISIDTPNHSLNIYLPKNEMTLSYFKRYNKFYLQGDDTCWRVEAVDWISTPGILEVTAVEYYANETADDVENGIVNGLLEPIEDPNPEVIVGIEGETFIKIKGKYEYSFSGNENLTWHVDKKYPIELIVDPSDGKKVSLSWVGPYSGQFDLFYGDYKKTIIVESLF